MPDNTPNTIPVILSRYESDDNGCHIWTGYADGQGYAQASYRGKLVRIHRLAFEASRGPILPGLHVHHICGARSCIRPDHLELVTPKDHHSRHLNTHCSRGHSLSGENLVVLTSGRRRCYMCQREYDRRWKLRNKEKIAQRRRHWKRQT